ncbi:MAG: alginate lyase family protein [Myxococcales bacterium]|nr:alginate lyase family protein [Myxococcales bacterium]
MRWRDQVQELRELGLGGTAYRLGREVSLRSGLLARETPRPGPPPRGFEAHALAALDRLPFAHPEAVALAMAGRIDDRALDQLVAQADDAAAGRIVCFGAETVDCGDPIDWHRNPFNGRRWDAALHWTRALAPTPTVGDVKLTWEAARFPQAYHLARAAALAGDGAQRRRWALAFARQVRGFLASNPYPFGIHWFSSQEMVIRATAWLFAMSVFHRLGIDQTALALDVAAHLWVVGHQLEAELAYAQRAVYNNHLVAEAFGLTLCARLLPAHPTTRRWAARGQAIVEAEAERQVYPDGGYINQSHNYARTALQDWALSARFTEADGGAVSPRIAAALGRSLSFLYAQQNPVDGRLPNYGSNDGSMPRVLTTCDFADFRPLLQLLGAMHLGVRLYEDGPHDEELCWTLGPGALDLPRVSPPRRSVSFTHTGYHVLRGADPSSFAFFRCGTVLDRFSQIDMLSVDLHWRGLNVLTDPGSYLYNAEARWHDHFVRTESHNTVGVDGLDQMLHARRFKTLYPTPARLTAWAPDRVSGSHDGFTREPEQLQHHRSVERLDDDLWVVIDTFRGPGAHTARLHWLGGPFDHTHDGFAMQLLTPEGPFSVRAFAPSGSPLAATVVRGANDPPRGWVSRTYNAKSPAPSFVCERSGEAPALAMLTVLSGGAPVAVSVDGSEWRFSRGQHSFTRTVTFEAP